MKPECDSCLREIDQNEDHMVLTNLEDGHLGLLHFHSGDNANRMSCWEGYVCSVAMSILESYMV